MPALSLWRTRRFIRQPGFSKVTRLALSFLQLLQRVLAPLMASHGDLLCKYFLDDGVHAGDLSGLERFLRELTRLASIGFCLNFPNCRLFAKGDVSGMELLRELPAQQEGLEFLGSPISSIPFLNESLTATFAKALDFCEQVEKVEDPQTCHQLLRLCAGTSRILHLMEVVPPAIILPFVQ